MHLDSPEALGVLNTLFESVAPSSLRPVDMLLKSMFTIPVTMVRSSYIYDNSLKSLQWFYLSWYLFFILKAVNHTSNPPGVSSYSAAVGLWYPSSAQSTHLPVH